MFYSHLLSVFRSCQALPYLMMSALLLCLEDPFPNSVYSLFIISALHKVSPTQNGFVSLTLLITSEFHLMISQNMSPCETTSLCFLPLSAVPTGLNMNPAFASLFQALGTGQAHSVLSIPMNSWMKGKFSQRKIFFCIG